MCQIICDLPPTHLHRLFLDSFLPFLMDEATFAADFLQLWEPTPLASSTASTRSTGRPAPHAARPGSLAAVVEESPQTAPLKRLTTEGTRCIQTMLDGVGRQCMVMVRWCFNFCLCNVMLYGTCVILFYFVSFPVFVFFRSNIYVMICVMIYVMIYVCHICDV